MDKRIVVTLSLWSALIIGCYNNNLILPNSPENSLSEEKHTETNPYATKERVRELVVDLLPHSGRLGATVGEIWGTGAVHIVKIMDQQKKGVVRNELVVRRDGAVMPIYGVRVSGEPEKKPVDSSEEARILSAIWLWRTNNRNMRVGTAYQTHFAYVVCIHHAKEPKKQVNQLIVRKDGFLLPVINRGTLSPKAVNSLRSAGGASFGWIDPFFAPDLAMGWDSGEWWGSDWDTGWWGSGWGWGWGSTGTWTKPNGQEQEDGDCEEGMSDDECGCLIRCREECKNAPPDHCFENCVDTCFINIS